MMLATGDTPIDTFTKLSLDPTSSMMTSQDKASASTAPARSVPKLSEIQNIAAHVTPPTVPSTRATPLENHLKRSDPFQFGSRYLEENDDVFAWNAWDHVDPTKDELFVSYSEKQYAFQREHAASDYDRKRFNAQPEKWWNKFYGNNEANFFKDRKWLRQEFPILAECTSAPIAAGDGAPGDGALQENGPMNIILEIGAGAGNTAFPLLKENQNPNLMIHACDFSSQAVKVLRSSAHYNPKHITATQWDMAASTLPEGVEAGSIDVVILVFAFSALAPTQWRQAVRNVWHALRPGGEVCFRDYGRGDLAQVRFKRGRLLGENFYVRGDGTRVYFFEEDELRAIWAEGMNGLKVEWEDAQEAVQDIPSFEIIGLGTDRRLLVNRQKQLKMYRCWMQGRFRKPMSSGSDTTGGVAKEAPS